MTNIEDRILGAALRSPSSARICLKIVAQKPLRGRMGLNQMCLEAIANCKIDGQNDLWWRDYCEFNGVKENCAALYEMLRVCREAHVDGDDAISICRKYAGEDGRFSPGGADDGLGETVEAEISKPECDGVDNLLDSIESQFKGEGLGIGLPWRRTTSAIGGLVPGSTVIIASPPGNGKSVLAMQMFAYLLSGGEPCAYLPLECNRKFFLRRLLSSVSKSWIPLCLEYGDHERNAAEAGRLLEKHIGEIRSFGRHIYENPLLPRTVDGELHMPELAAKDMLAWVKQALSEYRVVIVDPVTQVFTRSWEQEKKFVKRLMAVAAGSKSTLVCISHLKGQAVMKSKGKPDGESLAGVEDWRRFCDTLLLFSKHDERTSDVYRQNGSRESCRYNCNIYVDKSRGGNGLHSRIAMMQGNGVYEEIGTIIPE